MPPGPSNLSRLSLLPGCPSAVFGLEGLQPEGSLPDATVEVCLSHVRALATYRPDRLLGVSIDPNFEADWLESRLPGGVPVLTDQDHVTGPAPSVFHVLSLLADRSARSLWPRWARNPSVALAVSVHDDLTRQALDSPGKDPAGRLRSSRHRLISAADAVLAPSHAAALDAVGWAGVDPDKVFVAHQPAIPPAPAGPPGAEEPLSGRSLGGFDLRGGFVLAAASASSSMHNEVQVTAFASIDPAVRADRRLVLAAKHDLGRATARLNELIGSLDVHGDVLVATGLDDHDMSYLYRSCRVAFIGGVEDGSIAAALDAAAGGAGIVVADHDALMELVSQPDARYYPMAVDSTRSMLRRCLTDEEFCRARRHETAEGLAGYAERDTVDALIMAYRAALNARPRRALPAAAASL